MSDTVKNDFHVKKIQYLASAFTYCPIGKSWSRMHFEVNMEIDDLLPNYDVADDFFKNDVDGHEFLMEEAGYYVYKFFKDLCHPKSLQVIIHDENSSISTAYVTIEE